MILTDMESLTHKQRKMLFMLVALPLTLIIGWLTAQIPENPEVTLNQSQPQIIAPVQAEQ